MSYIFDHPTDNMNHRKFMIYVTGSYEPLLPDYFKKNDAKEVWDEINKMAEMAELWQIRKAYGTSQHSIWKSSGDYFLREGKYDVNSSASFDLSNGFFINLLNFGTN